ncbi:thioester reductase domain-containing protein [Amycolatopsis sp. NPDC049159]|uniref:thioester reductase domain-containing protein n=1 Tax=Amycolatopsis sp. NPDC049159 TaxID=3157210 RepID=UPI0033C34187
MTPQDDAVPDESVTGARSAPARSGPPERILLTGATGFLGAFLLRELLDRTGATVFCLVRGEAERVHRNLARYGLAREGDEDRVAVVGGALDRPSLGLDPLTAGLLAESMDAIVHNGSRVNLAEGYAPLKAANVEGTHEILRLAARYRVTPVHYVSSAGVAIPPRPVPAIREDRAVALEDVAPIGYLRTKWVAERLVRTAASRGIPASVYRPGRIAGHSRTGAGTADDAFWQLLRALVLVGAVPDTTGDVLIDLVPADHVAGSLVRLVRQPSALGRTYHLANSARIPFGTVLAALRSDGYALRVVSKSAFTDLVRASADPGVQRVALVNALVPSVLDTSDPVFDQRNVERALPSPGCPPVDEELITRYLRYLVGTGGFPAPTALPRVTQG